MGSQTSSDCSSLAGKRNSWETLPQDSDAKAPSPLLAPFLEQTIPPPKPRSARASSSDLPSGSERPVKACEITPIAQPVTETLDSARANLTKQAAESSLNATFQSDIEAFESRATKDRLSDLEIAKTYQAVCNILDESRTHLLSADHRKMLAEQIIHNAAMPIISQGDHETCIESELESRLYTRTPSVVASMLEQVSATGKYVIPDGSISVKLDKDSLIPHGEAKVNPPQDGKRGYASQLFQVTAVNVEYAADNQVAEKAGSPLRLRYEQHEPANGNSGERLSTYLRGFEHAPSGYSLKEPNLGDDRILDLSKKITGNPNEEPFIINRRLSGDELKDVINNQDVVLVGSSDELIRAVDQMKADHNLPGILDISTGNEPFYSEAHVDGGHSIGIRDIYADGAGTIVIPIANSWGTLSNHAGLEAIPADQLFVDTFDPNEPGALKSLQQIDAQKPNLDQESELVWLKLASGRYGKYSHFKLALLADDMTPVLEKTAQEMHDLGKNFDPKQGQAILSNLSNVLTFYELTDPDGHKLDSVKKALAAHTFDDGAGVSNYWALLKAQSDQIPCSGSVKAFFAQDPS